MTSECQTIGFWFTNSNNEVGQHTECRLTSYIGAELTCKSWATQHEREPNGTRQLKKYQTQSGVEPRVDDHYSRM